MLWYEHEVLAESMFVVAFVWAVAMAFPAGNKLRAKQVLGILLLSGVTVALKPHGRFLWLALLSVTCLHAWPPREWNRKIFATIAFTAVLILTSGERNQGAWLLLSSTLPLINPEGETLPEYRRVLRPLIEEARTVSPWRYGYVQRIYKGTSRPRRILQTEGRAPIGANWSPVPAIQIVP